MLQQLTDIINEKKLRILFQPIVNLSSRKPIGYEALMRGPAGTRLESPLDLLALANETNMLLELHMLSLGLTVKKAGFIGTDRILFVNVDPLIVSTEYFKNMSFLKESGINPSQVCIEITERTYIKSFSKLVMDLEYFKSLGGKVGVDDVGEGYASLRAIAELKPEFIKVDMDLVRNIDSDEVKSSLMRVILELSQRIKSCLVAEGIESEEENRALMGVGVEYGQGFLFARPSEIIP